MGDPVTDAPPHIPAELVLLEQALAELAGRISALGRGRLPAGDPAQDRIAQTLHDLMTGQSLKNAGSDPAARTMALRQAMKDLAAVMAAVTALAEGEASPIPALVRHIPHEAAGPGTSIAGRIRTLLSPD